jgi:hypothetical protein
VQSGRRLSTFRTSIAPQFSGSKSKQERECLCHTFYYVLYTSIIYYCFKLTALQN